MGRLREQLPAGGCLRVWSARGWQQLRRLAVACHSLGAGCASRNSSTKLKACLALLGNGPVASALLCSRDEPDKLHQHSPMHCTSNNQLAGDQPSVARRRQDCHPSAVITALRKVIT